MVSKNNRIKRMEEVADRQSHFGIRKLTVGAASVLLGTTLWMGTTSTSAQAATNGNGSDNDRDVTDESHSQKANTVKASDATKVVVDAQSSTNEQTQDKSEDTQSTDAADASSVQKAENNQEAVATQSSQTKSETAQNAKTTTESKTNKNTDQTAKATENAKAALRVQKQKAEKAADKTADTNKAATTTAQKAADSASVENGGVTSAATSQDALKSAGVAGNTKKTTTDKTADVDLTKSGLDGKASKEDLDTTQLNLLRTTVSALAENNGNKVDTSKYSAKQLEQMLGVSLVAQTTATNSDGEANITVSQPDTYQGQQVISRIKDEGTNGSSFIVTMDDNYTVYFYKDGNFVDSISADSTGQTHVTFNIYDASSNFKAKDTIESAPYYLDYQTISSGKYKLGRTYTKGPGINDVGGALSIDISGGSGSLVFTDKDGNTISAYKGGGFKDPAQGAPSTIDMNVWYVDEDTGDIISHKTKNDVPAYSEYDATGAKLDTIEANGKTYKLSDDQSAGIDKWGSKVLMTNNGVDITVDMIKDTPLTGEVGSHQIGDLLSTYNGGYQLPGFWLDQITDNKGDAYTQLWNLNSADQRDGDYIVQNATSQGSKPVTDANKNGFSISNYVNTRDYKPANANFVFFYKEKAADKQKADVIFVDDDNNEQVIPDAQTQTVEGDSNTQITFPNAASQVADILGQDYEYVKTTEQVGTDKDAKSVTGGDTGKYSSVVYPNYDDNTSVDQHFVIHFKKKTTTPTTPTDTTTYHAEVENKTVTRTINYYDKTTGATIPAKVIDKSGSKVTNPTIDSVTFTRNKVYDNKGNFVGYGTVSDGGKTYTPAATTQWGKGWTIASDSKDDDAEFDEVTSPDLQSQYYTTPTGGENATTDTTTPAPSVSSWDVMPTDPDRVYNIYYGHQTQPIEDTDTVKRTFHYIFTDSDKEGIPGDGSTTTPYSHADQVITFKGTGTKDLVTGKETITWTPETDDLTEVDPETNIPGYKLKYVWNDGVNTGNKYAEDISVKPGDSDHSATFIYDPDPDLQKAKVTIVDITDKDNPKPSKTLSYFTNYNGKDGDPIIFTVKGSANESEDGSKQTLQSYLDSGYEFVKAVEGTPIQNVTSVADITGTSIGDSASDINYGNFNTKTDDVQNFTIYLAHKTKKDTQTDKTTSTVHYVVSGDDPDKPDAPQDNVQTVNWTKTDTTDLVTGTTTEGTWTPEPSGNYKDVESPDVTGYTPDKSNVTGATPERGNNPYTVVVYSKNEAPVKNPQKAVVQVFDKTDNNTLLGTINNNNGTEGETITFDGLKDLVKAYTDHGYQYNNAVDDTDGTKDLTYNTTDGTGFPTFDGVDDNTQSFKIYLTHKTEPADADATAHVHYIMSDGTTAPDDSPEQKITFKGTKDLVTGKVTYDTNSDKFTDVKSPDVDGYTPDTPNVSFDTPEPGKNQVVNVIYTPNQKQAQKASLKIVDKTDNKTLVEGLTDSGDSGAEISFPAEKSLVDTFINNGYKFASAVNDADNSSIGTDKDKLDFGNFDDDSSKDQAFTIYLVHDTEDSTEKGTTTETIHYVYSDGTTAKPDNTQTINWTRPVTIDKVTNEKTPTGDWTNTESYNDVTSPTIDGYTPSTDNVKAPTPNYPENPVTTVIYNKTPDKAASIQKADLLIHDNTSNIDLGTYTNQGEENDPISFSGSNDQINYLLNHGYKFDPTEGFVNDKGAKSTPKSTSDLIYGTYDTDADNTDSQHFVVNLVHETEPVDPDHPGHGYSKTDLDKKVTRTINYLDEQGNKIADSVTKTVEFKGSGVVDKVTGKFVTSDTDLTPLADQSKGITWTKTVDGQTTDGNTYEFGATDAKPSIDYNNTTYNYNHVDNKTYDGTNGAVKAYDVSAPDNVNDLTVNVIYNMPTPEAKDQVAQVVYRDLDNDKRPIEGTGSGNLTGESGSKIDYQTQPTITDLEKKGYILVNNGFDPDGQVQYYDNNDDTTQTYYVDLRHKTVPVDPEHPKDPDQPVDPDNPDNPTTPADGQPSMTKTDLEKTVTRTIHYVEKGNESNVLADPVTETVTFTRSGVMDTVTGKLVNLNDDGSIKDENGTLTDWTYTASNGTKGDSSTYKFAQTGDKEYINKGDVQYKYDSVSDNQAAETGKGAVKSWDVTPSDTSQDVTVYYTKVTNPVKQEGSVTVIFHDDTSNVDIPGYGTKTGTKETGTETGYTSQPDIDALTKKGYVYVPTDGDQVPSTIPDGDQTVTIHMKHATVPVDPKDPHDPNTPINPDDPNSPEYPDGTDAVSLTKNVKRTVTYIISDGKVEAPTPVTDALTFEGAGHIDKVTGNWVTVDDNGDVTGKSSGLTWTIKDGSEDKGSFKAVNSPEVTGYHVVSVSSHNDGKNNVDAIGGITHTSSDIDVQVVYAPDAPTTPEVTPTSGSVTYIDDTTGKDLEKANFSGNVGDKIDYTTQDRIDYYTGNGYQLVGTDPFKDGEQTYVKDVAGNTFEIHFTHTTTSITPDNPGTYPGVLDKTITRTVKYVYADGSDKTIKPVEQSVHFTGSGTYDNVTHQLVNVDKDGKITQDGKITWTADPSDSTYAEVPAISDSDLDGYEITNVSENNTTAAVDKTNGKVASEKIDQDAQNSQIVITLNKKPATPTPAKDQGSLTVIFHDDTDNVDIPGVGTKTGDQDVKTPVTYNPTDDQTKLENQGYVYVSTDGTIPKEITKGNTTVTIHMKHGTRPVTPDNPVDPDHPVDPKHPDNPSNKDPQKGLTTVDLEKSVTRNISYQFTDGTQPTAHGLKNLTQKVDFKGEGTIDLVTGNLVDVDKDGNITGKGSITWTPDKGTLAEVAGKNVDGYEITGTINAASDGSVSAQDVTPTSVVQDAVIIYSPVAKPVPGDEKAKLTIIDRNDPDNPSTLNSYDSTGKANTDITFSGSKNYVDQLINSGYVIDGYKVGDGQETKPSSFDSVDFGKFDNDENTDQDFTLYLVHGTTPVTPDEPGEPGKPVDPNNPTGPKYPDGTAKSDLVRSTTQTIVYHYADGSQPDKSVTTTHENAFTRNKVFDNVTGEIIKDSGWNKTEDKFDTVQTPKVDGYNADKPEAGGLTATVDKPNVTDTVVYTPVAKPTPQTVSGNITYTDDVTGRTLEQTSFQGNVGDKINYTTADRISYYTNNGYKLVSNDFTDGQETYQDSGNVFNVHLTHATTPITPDNPGDGYTKDDLDKTITRTVQYIYSDGSKTVKPVEQSVHFTGSGTYDNVTHQLVNVDKDGKITPGGKIVWTPENDNFDEVPGIDMTGYHVSGVKETGTNADVDTTTAKVNGETVDHNSPNSQVIITLTKNQETPVAATGKITYFDDTTGNTLEGGSFSGSVGQLIPYTTKDRVAHYESMGYKLVSNDFNDGTQKFVRNENDKSNVFEVHFVHATTPVTPDNPGKPGEPVDPSNPDGPKFPDNYIPQTLTKTVTRDVTYVYADGSQAQSPVKQTVNFNGNGVVDLVTGGLVTVDQDGKITPNGNITWTPENGEFQAVPGIDTTKYNITQISKNNTNANVDETNGKVASETVTPKSNNSSIVITLDKKPAPVTPVKDQGSIKVTVHDVTDNVDLPDYGKDSGNQDVGSDFKYDVPGTVTELTNKGYKVINPNVVVPTKITKGDQNIVIYVEHDTIPVTPDNPGTPGQPINPDDPEGPKWPDGTDKTSLTTTGTQTVHYTGAGDNTPKDSVTTVTFEHHMVIDKVTGKTVTDEGWTPASQTYKTIVTPTIAGYTPDQVSAGGETVTQSNPNRTYTVTYTKNPETPVAVTGSITYIDDTTGGTLQTANFQGNVGDKINYTTSDKIADYEKHGYKLVSNDFNDGTQVFTKDNNIFEVHLAHTTTTVTPDKPGTPGDPIDPSNPTGPRYPSGTDENSLKKTVTQTVHYVGAGDKTPSDKTQSVTFTKEITFDNVTGEVTKDSGWNEDSHKFTSETTPVIDGYHADKKTAGGSTVTPTDNDINVTVTYSPNGHIVPVDPDGNPIPGVDTPTFPTDPTDPTKVDDGKVPEVPSTWNPVDHKPGDNINPDPQDPGKDVEVPFTPVTPTKQGSITVVVHDNTTGQDLPDYRTSSGTKDQGSDFDFDKPGTITKLEDHGYKVINPDVTIPTTVGDHDETVTIYVEHQIIPVTPDNPGTPGEPINPNDPEGPKWPDGTDKDSLTTTGTQTVHYTGAGDNTPQDSTTTVVFTHSMTIDKVTGETTDNGWTPDTQTYNNIASPVVTGYTPDKAVVGGETVTRDNPNRTYTVTYTKNPEVPVAVSGKISYIDDTTGTTLDSDNLSGNVGDKINYTTADKIANYEKHGYKLVSNDFQDGTQVFAKDGNIFEVHLAHTTTTVTPDKPGTPGDPIDPSNPTGPRYPSGTDENSLKKTVTQTVHYQGAGDKTPSDKTQSVTFTKEITFDNVTGEITKDSGWNEDSHKFTSENTPVVEGYHADKKTAGGSTVTPDSEDTTVTVTYTENGKIVPVDPDGNKIPNAETPTYVTDPDDPTKVVPDEEVPEVKGRTPEKTTVTPEDPGKDTPVVYTEQGSLTIIVHDQTTDTNLVNYGYNSGTLEDGSKVDYDWTTKKKDLEDKGYVIVTPDVSIPSTVGNTAQTITIEVKHGTTPVNPDNPGKPGEPINPNDPNGAKWPDGTDKGSLTKTGTQTVHYTGAGNNTPKDNVTTVNFSHSEVIDKVTGKVIEDDGWTPDTQTYTKVTTPTVDGYTPDKTVVGGDTVNVNGDIDREYTVTYTENAPSTPVTPTPQPTVTTVTGKQTITFVDGDNGNTPLRDADVQTHDFTITDGVPSENSYTFGTVNVPVIDGYVATVTTAGGKTVTPDNPDANVVVVYHKIGKIVPVDKDHNPIPGVDTPSYKNDPSDPTKVVPDEAVPVIDGYTPSETTVTPSDPTKDTEVVYTKNGNLEPDEPSDDTPDEPDEPTPTPKKKHKTTNTPKPSKPATPKKTSWSTNNAPHAQSGYWSNNVAPHGQSVNGWSNNIGPHGETVDSNGNIVAPDGEIIGYVDAQGNAHYTKTLPQTGSNDKQSEAAAALGAAAMGLSMIGLAGVKKRRKRN